MEEESAFPSSAGNFTENLEVQIFPRSVEESKGRLINITDNETCIITHHDDLYVCDFLMQTNRHMNETIKDDEYHLVMYEEGESGYSGSKGIPACFTFVTTLSYYLFSNLRISDTISCKPKNEDTGRDLCVCNFIKNKLKKNENFGCLCSLYEAHNENSNHTEEAEVEKYLFRRNCTLVLKSVNHLSYPRWISNCTFVYTPFSFEAQYFNESNTSDDITYGNSSSICNNPKIRKTRSLIEEPSFIPSESFQTSPEMHAKISPSASSSSQKKSDYVSNQSIQNTFTSIKYSNKDSQSHMLIHNPIKRSFLVVNNDDIGEQNIGKAINIGNSFDGSFTTSRIMPLLLLLIYLITYCGFLRKERLGINKKKYKL